MKIILVKLYIIFIKFRHFFVNFTYNLLHNSNSEVIFFYSGFMIAQEKSDTYWVKKYAGGMEFDIYAQAAQRFSGENPIIFDVGANIGMTSLFFSRVPSAKVEAFEPVERTFSFLQKNLSNNHIDNVRTHNIGFSNRSGELAIGGEKPEESSGTFKVREKSDHGYSEIARFETMDEFVKRLKIDHVDYVKIDCEGHEINIIEGCKEVILNLILFSNSKFTLQ